MPGDYDILAAVYNRLKLADFALATTPRILNHIQRADWLGRRILDLGCGTGASAHWLASYGYIITGIDREAKMLASARRPNTSSVHFEQQDIRKLDSSHGIYDLIFALNVMNELESLNDLKAVFDGVHPILEARKLFIFDMHTIQGLTVSSDIKDSIVVNDNDLTVMLQNQYDYERQLSTRRYLIFRHEETAENSQWHRSEASVLLRAFPIQAVAALLQRSGFGSVSVLNLDLAPIEPGTASVTRAIFVAKKE
jgi:SAM-dependent methyltransferase